MPNKAVHIIFSVVIHKTSINGKHDPLIWDMGIQNGAAVFSRHSGSSAHIVLLSTFLHIFTFSFYTHNICTDYLRQKKIFGRWTLYPRIQRGHWRFFETQRRTKAT